MTKSDFAVAAPTPAGLENRILELLPNDGTPVLDRVMRVLLSRELEQRIDPDLYFEACDRLARKGKIGRLRGQSGQIFLSGRAASQPAPAPEPAKIWSKARLMPPVRTYLESVFRAGLDLPEDAAAIVLDTSSLGPQRGRWARPDFVLVSAMRFKLLPGAEVDVHSFELKTEVSGSVLAVHEALAQTRYTHFGHLIWHLPAMSRRETALPEVEDHCKKHGIGLIRIRDPRDPAGYENIHDPVRKATSPAATEAFLDLRLSEDQKQRLARVVRG
jgi:hypothetical protein